MNVAAARHTVTELVLSLDSMIGFFKVHATRRCMSSARSRVLERAPVEGGLWHSGRRWVTREEAGTARSGQARGCSWKAAPVVNMEGDVGPTGWRTVCRE